MLTRVVLLCALSLAAASPVPEAQPLSMAPELAAKPEAEAEVKLPLPNVAPAATEEAAAPASDVSQAVLFQIGDQPVDFVFSWTNGQDGDAAKVREKFLKESGMPEQKAKDEAGSKRFTDAGELKYALRSVHKYAPWVNRIYILMADNEKPPEWLADPSGKVTIVRHGQVFPEGSTLPTYDSHSIETSVHRIPGLTRKFVYFNDDMFLNQPIEKTLYFTEGGRPKAFFSSYDPVLGPVTDEDPAFLAGRKNSNKLIQKLQGKNAAEVTNRVPVHAGYAMDRDECFAIEAKLGDEFSKLRKARFRSNSDFWPTMVFVKYATLTGTGQESQPNPSFMAFHFAKLGAGEDPTIVHSKFDELRKNNPVMFNVNDSEPGMVEDLAQELRQMFPNEAPWEHKK